MSDREKVVSGLRCCSEMNGEHCRKCPYQDECRDGYGIPHLANDALELLEESAKDNNVHCKWISVKDKLPELGKNVLVYIERNAYRGNKITRKREIAIGWHIKGLWHVDGCSEVVVFSATPGNTAEDMAQQLDTISYEVLTSVSSRVKRIYTKE